MENIYKVKYQEVRGNELITIDTGMVFVGTVDAVVYVQVMNEHDRKFHTGEYRNYFLELV